VEIQIVSHSMTNKTKLVKWKRKGKILSTRILLHSYRIEAEVAVALSDLKARLLVSRAARLKATTLSATRPSWTVKRAEKVSLNWKVLPKGQVKPVCAPNLALRQPRRIELLQQLQGSHHRKAEAIAETTRVRRGLSTRSKTWWSSINLAMFSPTDALTIETRKSPNSPTVQPSTCLQELLNVYHYPP